MNTSKFEPEDYEGLKRIVTVKTPFAKVCEFLMNTPGRMKRKARAQWIIRSTGLHPQQVYHALRRLEQHKLLETVMVLQAESEAGLPQPIYRLREEVTYDRLYALMS